MKRFILYTLIGLPVLCAVGSLVVGAEQFFSLVFLSVVCTFGIGLLLWLPLSYLVGWIFVKLLRFVPGWENALISLDKKKKQPTKDVNRTLAPVVQYIINVQSAGMTKEEIDQSLKEAGWSDDQIFLAKTKL